MCERHLFGLNFIPAILVGRDGGVSRDGRVREDERVPRDERVPSDGLLMMDDNLGWEVCALLYSGFQHSGEGLGLRVECLRVWGG